MARCIFPALVAFASLWAAQNVIAVPKPSEDGIRSLFKRHQVVFEDCGADDDPKRVTADKAWKEAARLATFTIENSLDDGTEFQGTNAFSHYFEDADAINVTSMNGNIQAGSSDDQGNAFQLKFIISCEDSLACVDSLAVTDAAPLTDTFTPTIRLCPTFFTSPRTTKNLDSKGTKRNPSRRDNSWCQPNQPFEFFETAGHTFLHEMTHLDQLGVVAALSERDTLEPGVSSHGSDDIYAIAGGYNPRSPEQSARTLKDNWTKYSKDNSNTKPVLRRIENAESYAASATEFWFHSNCGWDNIEP